jgi:hypothetical protein
VIVRFFVRFLIGAAFLLSAQFAMAQVAGQGGVNPGQALGQFRDGGPEMVKQVRDLVAADKAAVAAIIAFARTANEDQRKAIAEGLAQTAKANAQADPAFANQIQQAVAASGLPELAKAYAEAAGDTGTASTGGGGGGGGPINGAPTGGPNNGIFNPANSFAANTTPNLLTGGTVGGGGFSQFSPF